MSEFKVVALTGANGYVGQTLYSALRAFGHRVIRLQRRRPDTGDPRDHIAYSLEGGPAQPLPPEVSVVIHCAYDLRLHQPADIQRVNLGGFEQLIRAAGQRTIIHISSMSAYAGTRQTYGQTKLACEELTSQRGGISLRLGLVYGDTDGGMTGSLRKLAALPVVPQLRPSTYQYTVHADDVARCVLSALQDHPPHSVIGVANPRRVPFDEIMGTLRGSRSSRRLLRVPVSALQIYRLLRAAEASRLRTGFRADSMLGLMHPAPEVPHVEYWHTRGITFHPFI